MSYLKSKMLCDKNQDGFHVCLCDIHAYMNNFPDIVFTIGNSKYSMTKETYVERFGERCSLKLRAYDFTKDSTTW